MRLQRAAAMVTQASKRRGRGRAGGIGVGAATWGVVGAAGSGLVVLGEGGI